MFFRKASRKQNPYVLARQWWYLNQGNYTNSGYPF